MTYVEEILLIDVCKFTIFSADRQTASAKIWIKKSYTQRHIPTAHL